MFRFTLKAGLIFGALFILSLQPAFARGEVRYTRYNIHTQSKDGKTGKASYANYTRPGTGHVIVPAGTRILVTARSRKRFTFTYDDNSHKVVFAFHKSRMGMSLNDYLDKITSSEPTSLDGLSKLDRQGVKEGKALVGMSRAGVMTALGYPAAHRTPSLDAKTWVYWTNRFKTIGVDFDEAGKVSAVRN